MVRVSYHAQQQLDGLSPPERLDLARLLESGEAQTGTTSRDISGRFISRFGEDKRVVWSKDDGGNIIVLAVVAR